MKSKLIIFISFIILIVTNYLLLKQYHNTKNEITARFAQEQVSTATLIGHEIESFLNNRSTSLNVYTTFSEIQYKNRDKISETVEKIFSYLKKHHVKSISVFDEKGTIIYSTANQVIGKHFSKSDFFQWARIKTNKNKQFISLQTELAQLQNTQSHSLLVLVAAPIYQDKNNPLYGLPSHQFVGVITITIDLEKIISKLLTDVNINLDRQNIWIIDKSRTIIYNPAHPEMVSKNFYQRDDDCMQCHISFDHIEKMFTQKKGYAEFRLIDAPKKLVSFTSIECKNISWKIVLDVPMEEISGFIRSSLITTLILVGVIALTFIGGFIIIYRNYQSKMLAEAETKTFREKQQLKSKLIEAEDRWYSLVKNAPNIIIIIDRDEKISFINRVLPGFDVNEVIGESIYKFVEPMFVEVMKKTFDHVFKTGEINSYEIIGQGSNGKQAWYLSQVSPLIQNGVIDSLLIITTDITERKETESEIMFQKNKFAQLFDNSPLAIVLLDKDGKIVNVNESFSNMFGFFESEIKGKDLNDLVVPPELKEEGERLSNETYRGGQINKESYRMKKDGSFIYVQIISMPIRVNDHIVGIFGMYEDRSQRKEYQEAIINAKEKAESANKLKDLFIANMSHEIRTPLNGIIGMTSIIKELVESQLSPEDRYLFEGIDDASKRVIRTIDLILNYSLLSIGEYITNPQIIELSKICETLIDNYMYLARNKSLTLSFENKCGKAFIKADEYSVIQVISNLLDNAVKFTNEGFAKLVLFASIDDEIMLSVIDSGIGIHENYMKVLYEPYLQESMGYERIYEGLGLGLTLVKKFLNLNNASISAESKKGVGTTFTINFGKRTSLYKEISISEKINETEEILPVKQDVTILVVENDINSQILIRRMLEKYLITLITDSYDNVYELLDNHKVNLILMDISIKGRKNGLELTKELKANKKYSAIPIITVADHSFERRRLYARDAGSDGFIVKPFTKEKLHQIIGKFIKK
jgi:PAS domain S-box-containing protein